MRTCSNPLSAAARPRRRWPRLAIATQTCEQSLDIDADLLVTDACPADVLLQRAGRVQRDCRDAQTRTFAGCARRRREIDSRDEFPRVCPHRRYRKAISPCVEPNVLSGIAVFKTGQPA